MLSRWVVLSLLVLPTTVLKADSITTDVVCHFGTTVVSSPTGCSEDGPSGVSGAGVTATYSVPKDGAVQLSVSGSVFPQRGNQSVFANVDLNLSTTGPRRPGYLHVDFSPLQSQAIIVPFADAFLELNIGSLFGGCGMYGLNTACAFPGFTTVSSTGPFSTSKISGTAVLPFELGTSFNVNALLDLWTTENTGLDGRGTGIVDNMSFYLTDANGNQVTIDDGIKLRSFLVTDPAAETPEPVTFLLVAGGLGLAGALRLARSKS